MVSSKYLRVSYPDRSNLKLSFTGMDSIECCRNKKHFSEYQKPISYQYNSFGFRDRKWPKDIKNAIWCVGDSFTTGIGQPWQETWPSLLENTIQQRCFNLGEDGCSNDLMALRIEEIFQYHQPKKVIVMWSYLSRRFVKRKNVQFNIDKKELFEDDLKNFIENLLKVDQFSDKIIHLTIPNCWTNDSHRKETLNSVIRSNVETILPNIIEIEQIDFSRDGHHFDLETSKNVIQKILPLL